MLDFLLRPGRITKYSPSFKGFRHLIALYQRLLPAGATFRIHDFDKDLRLDVNIQETIGISLWHYPDLYEREERKVFCASVTPGCTVLDVGANIGIYTLLAAKRGARVFAVEADPANAVALRHHVELNGFSERVTVFEIAATECAKTVPLYRNPRNSGGSNLFRGQPSGAVEGRTLDSLALPPIDVCKMDIEGSELMALAGMQGTIERSPNLRLLIEYSTEFGNGEALLQYLKANFPRVRVIGGAGDELPPLCNLLATKTS